MCYKKQELLKGTSLLCIKSHTNGKFTEGRIYKVNAYQWVDDTIVGIRVRDDSREREDFNFVPTSVNYVWKYFRLV